MRAACIQMCSAADRDANLASADALLADAAEQGAELALLPENFSLMGVNAAKKRAMAEDENTSVTLDFLSQQAARHQMYIIGGSLLLHGENDALRNACPTFDAKGKLLSIYL